MGRVPSRVFFTHHHNLDCEVGACCGAMVGILRKRLLPIAVEEDDKVGGHVDRGNNEKKEGCNRHAYAVAFPAHCTSGVDDLLFEKKKTKNSGETLETLLDLTS